VKAGTAAGFPHCGRATALKAAGTWKALGDNSDTKGLQKAAGRLKW